MSSSKVTIKDVAKRAGVSIATVSRYLNNPSSIKKENRTKVDEAVKELHYHPLIFAQRLAGGKLNTFGLIIPGYEGIFYSFYALEIIRGIAANLDKEGIDLHLHIFWNKDNFNTSLVEGVIFADIIGNEKQLKRLIREQVPLVVINRKVTDHEVSFVTIDNFKGAYEATEFLAHHRHKKIAHLAGDLRVQCAQERLDGYKAALEKNKIEIRKEYIKITNFSRRETRERLEELFSLKEAPTALFCCSDEVAQEVLNFAEERKLSIPKDLSVVGFDDNHLLAYGNLLLTTVRQPLIKMASTSIQILKDIVEKKIPPQKVVLGPELVIRDTVGFL
ncbi:MAG: LacI family DNA-binding transcriptional regulator [Candidatus Omnitrophota bacterium]|nr:MAG: LacI family DNA-binding transcriptional regulator [Candidatus Omnitrophota bacterium]